MRIHDMPQRSPEWFALKSTRVTASEAGKFLLKDDARSIEARKKLISLKLACMAEAEISQVFETYPMRRGNDLEPEARDYFTEETGLEVEEVGFVEMDSLFGCSPDGFVSSREGLLQIKCPMGETHVRYLLDGVLPEQYKLQVHFEMVVTGASTSHFYSYCPALPSLHVKVARDGFTAQIATGMEKLRLEFIKAKREVFEIWERMKARKRASGEKEVAA